MKVVVPCCGMSTRFPNMRPKWMLNDFDGRLMVQAAIEGLPVRPKDVIISILSEVEEAYKVSTGLRRAIGEELQICILPKRTRNQPETVARTIEVMKIDEAVFVKDSDNRFSLKRLEQNSNYVCFETLQHFDVINPRNKSYLQMNQDGLVIQIVEKKVISSHFSVGGYYFRDAREYLKYFRELESQLPKEEDLYLSHIMNYMISEGQTIAAEQVTDYEDWGTLEDWRRARSQRRTFFIDLDGILFKNGAEFFEPLWGTTEAIPENIAAVKQLLRKGNRVFITTARPEKYRVVTMGQLKEQGLESVELVMGCGNSQRVLVNDFSNTNGYPSAVAINVTRDGTDLGKYLD